MPHCVAREKGYFREVGLDVDLVAPADPNDPPKLVAAGKADLAISYQPQLQMQAAEGLPADPDRHADLHTAQHAWWRWPMVRSESIKDLKGRKVGFSVGGLGRRATAAPAGGIPG